MNVWVYNGFIIQYIPPEDILYDYIIHINKLATRLRNEVRKMIIYKISRMTFEDTITLGRIDVINDSAYTTIGNKDDNHTLHAYKPINTLYKC